MTTYSTHCQKKGQHGRVKQTPDTVLSKWDTSVEFGARDEPISNGEHGFNNPHIRELEMDKTKTGIYERKSNSLHSKLIAEYQKMCSLHSNSESEFQNSSSLRPVVVAEYQTSNSLHNESTTECPETNPRSQLGLECHLSSTLHSNSEFELRKSSSPYSKPASQFQKSNSLHLISDSDYKYSSFHPKSYSLHSKLDSDYQKLNDLQLQTDQECQKLSAVPSDSEYHKSNSLYSKPASEHNHLNSLHSKFDSKCHESSVLHSRSTSSDTCDSFTSSKSSPQGGRTGQGSDLLVADLSDPRLSPRVMVSADLSHVKMLGAHGVSTALVVSNFLQHRATSPALPVGADSARPAAGQQDPRSTPVNTRKQQLKAYVDWLNSQLKKKPGARLVEDLRNDVKDGVALVELIEVVAGEKLAGYHEAPANQTEMKENIDRVIQFMATNRIRMHHISAKDVVDGNLKAIMRLILALAAHFKPKSVKHSAHQQIRAERNANISGIAQGASAALADARRHASRAGNRFRRNRDAAVSQRRYQESSSDQFSDSDQPYTPQQAGGGGGGRTRSRLSRDRRELEGAGSDSPASQRHTPRSSLRFSAESTGGVTPPPRSKSTDSVSKDFYNSNVDTERREKAQLDELTNTVKETKHKLLRLQDLLLCGESCDGQVLFNEVFEGDTPSEKIVVLRSRLQQVSEVSNDLREELSRTKNECLQLEGTKAGLQQRLVEQDCRISELKSQMLKGDFERENVLAEKAALVQQMKEKDKLIADLRRDLSKRDEKLDQLHHDTRAQLQEKERANQNLKSRIVELHNKLREDSLSLRVESQDKKMAKLAGRIFQSPPDNKHSTAKTQGSDELQMIRDSLQSLRVGMSPSDPQHHVVDTLEHSIALLLNSNRTATTHPAVSQSQKVRSSSPKRLNFEKPQSSSVNRPQSSPVNRPQCSSVNRPQSSSVDRPHSSSVNKTQSTSGAGFGLNELSNPPTNGQLCTKVLYFTEQAVTPFMGTIHKRLGEITLKDLKTMFDRPGAYKYHFKALDPEYGTVKEELHYDDDVIPGWEGKIVAWIEEVHGTPC